MNNVNVSIIEKDWLHKPPTYFSKTQSNEIGYFLTKPSIIRYNDDLKAIQRISSRYLKLILFQKKGYVSDTIPIEKFWKSSDTIAVIDTVFLKPVK